MFLKRSKSGRSTVRPASVIHEPESQRLQRDIELITSRLEHEKRESNYLDERIEMMLHELSLLSQKSKPSKKPVSSRTKTLRSTLAILEKSLEIEIVQLNETVAKKTKIRATIDEHRLEKLSYKRSLNCLQEDLKGFSSQAEQKNLEYRQGEVSDQEKRKLISVLRCKSASNQSKYGERISQLNSCLQEDKEQRSKIFKLMELDVKHNINKPIEGIEVSKILKVVLEKWANKTKEKKKGLDNYLKYIKVVEDAFNQIKQATGINQVEDIVVEFVKSQEQNQEIYAYMNALNSEIDGLEDSLRFVNEKIGFMEMFKEAGTKSITEAKENFDRTLNRTQDKTEGKQKKIEKIRNEILICFPIMSKIISVFKMVKITPQLNRKFENTWLDDLNEENIMSSLGYIEEFVNYMMILLAYSVNDQNPILGHNPLNSVYFDENEEQSVLELKDLLDDKDLYDDKEIEESKNPIPVSELQKKVRVIVQKPKAKV